VAVCLNMRILVIFPDGAVSEHELTGDSIRVGAGSDVELSLPGLQPLEAVIRRRGDRFMIHPAENSKVYIGDQRLLLPKQISPPSEIKVGAYTIRFEGTHQPPEEGEPGEFPYEIDTAPTEFLELPPEIIPRLQVTGGPDKGKTFEILGTAVLGRDPSADFSLSDRFVSRHHIRFYLAEDGSVVAEDIGGKNPILINGRVMPKKTLVHGDVIRVGQTELLFIYETQGLAEEEKPRRLAVKPWAWATVGAALFLAILATVSWIIVSRNSVSARKEKAHMLLVQAEAAQRPHDKARLYSEAVSLLEDAAKRSPKDPEIAEGLRIASLNQRLWTHILSAEENLSAGDYRAALREADAALAEAPDNPQALQLKEDATARLFSVTYEERARSSLSSRDPASALVFAEMALSASPWDQRLVSLKDSCLKALAEAKEKSPSGDAALFDQLRKKHYRDADPEATLELAQKILSSRPDDPAALYYKTIAEMEVAALESERAGRTAEAADIWRRIARIEPTNPLARRRVR